MAKSIAFTEDAMRARFAELEVAIKAIEDESTPLREERDRVVNEARDRERELNEAIHKIERGTKGENKLFTMKQEQGMIIRALKGRTAGTVQVAKTAIDPPAEVVE